MLTVLKINVSIRARGTQVLFFSPLAVGNQEYFHACLFGEGCKMKKFRDSVNLFIFVALAVNPSRKSLKLCREIPTHKYMKSKIRSRPQSDVRDPEPAPDSEPEPPQKVPGSTTLLLT